MAPKSNLHLLEQPRIRFAPLAWMDESLSFHRRQRGRLVRLAPHSSLWGSKTTLCGFLPSSHSHPLLPSPYCYVLPNIAPQRRRSICMLLSFVYSTKLVFAIHIPSHHSWSMQSFGREEYPSSGHSRSRWLVGLCWWWVILVSKYVPWACMNNGLNHEWIYFSMAWLFHGIHVFGRHSVVVRLIRSWRHNTYFVLVSNCAF